MDFKVLSHQSTHLKMTKFLVEKDKALKNSSINRDRVWAEVEGA